MKSVFDKLEAIVIACVTANPDIEKRYRLRVNLAEKADQIRRTDVAAALLLDRSKARRERNLEALDFWWNFTRDKLSSQSEECIGFTYDRLADRQN